MVRRAPVAETAGVSSRHLFGIDVLAAKAEEAVRLLDGRIDRGEPVKLAFLNSHGCNIAAADAKFYLTLTNCLVFNDGAGIDIAARVIGGAPFPENLNGTDFVPRYLAATRHRLRIYLIGAAPGIARIAAARLALLAPQHEFVGSESGYFSAEEETALIERVRTAKTDLLLVAMGNPKQEFFIERTFLASRCRMAIAVGGLFDFLAGEKPRAPAALRRHGLEWLFRFAIEPRRMWRRYLLGNPLFLGRVAVARLRMSSARRRQAAQGRVG